MNNDINTRAMLVSLSTSVFNPTKLDRRITEEVTTAKQAAKDAGNYRKQLIPKEVIDPVLKAANAIYLDHKRLTSPWADGGTRLLCIDMFETYSDTIAGGMRIFEKAVDDFIRRYDDIRQQAPVRMGATFDPRDYPPLAEVRSRFAIRTDWQPLPNGSDFRLHLQEDELNELRASVDERVQRAVRDARTDLHERLKDRLRHVSERLSSPDNVFRDSMIEGLRDLCKLLPRMCLQPDKDLERAVDATILGIAKYDPQELRDDDSKRTAARKAADAILATMAGMGGEVAA